MLQDCLNTNSSLHISVEHLSDQVQIIVAHDVRYTQVVVHNLVDAIERIFFVHDGIQKNSKSPNVLLFASIR